MRHARFLAISCAVALQNAPGFGEVSPATFDYQTSEFCGRSPERYSEIKSFHVEMRERFLADAGEPSFASAEHVPGEVRLRFLWLRSFEPPVIVDIRWNKDGTAKLTARQLSRPDDPSPFTVTKSIDRILTPDEAAQIAAARASLNFSGIDCKFGLDGSSWELEVIDEAGYRFVDRWTPEDDPVRDLGLAILALTGWELDPIY